MSGVVYGANFEGPDSVENTIAEQKAQKKSWRESLADDGITFGADYNALGLTSNSGSMGNDVDASSGVARFLFLTFLFVFNFSIRNTILHHLHSELGLVCLSLLLMK